MSELSPVSHITPFDGGLLNMHDEAPLSSVGWTVSNAASKLVDPESGDEIDPPAEGLSKTGELWFKGPNVMAGYLNNDEATRATIDDDGWLHTGDLARRDAEGFFYIAGRKKEMFISGGVNVYPAEIEAELVSHPRVADAAVIPIADETWGEVAIAFIVGDATEEDLTAYLGARIAKFKLPKRYVFIDALPRTPYGKVEKAKLAQALIQ